MCLKVWVQVWEEATSGALSSVPRMFGNEILDGVVLYLESSIWRLRRSAAAIVVEVQMSLFRRKRSLLFLFEMAGNSVGQSALGPRAIALETTLIASIKGRLFPGKFKLLEALGALVKHVGGGGEVVLKAVLVEAAKKDLIHKRHALQVHSSRSPFDTLFILPPMLAIIHLIRFRVQPRPLS